jgi:hypothetical protein
VAVVVALCCFRVAWLMDRPADDGPGTGSDRQA